jgi:hypothetical protein
MKWGMKFQSLCNEFKNVFLLIKILEIKAAILYCIFYWSVIIVWSMEQRSEIKPEYWWEKVRITWTERERQSMPIFHEFKNDKINEK